MEISEKYSKKVIFYNVRTEKDAHSLYVDFPHQSQVEVLTSFLVYRSKDVSIFLRDSESLQFNVLGHYG